MDFLFRFAQVPHSSFKLPELQTLAELEKLDFKLLDYEEKSPYAVISLNSLEDAKKLIRRSILGKAIYEIWGAGSTYEELHADVRARMAKYGFLEKYREASFRFEFDSYGGKRSTEEQREIMESFKYTALEGPILMKNPDEVFCVVEEYDYRELRTIIRTEANLVQAAHGAGASVESEAAVNGGSDAMEGDTEGQDDEVNDGDSKDIPRRYFLGRLVGTGSRHLSNTFDLKKRHYIGTTSMDAELSLITANFAHAAPGKLIYDPFVGTGSFLLACAHFGAVTMGSDIDGRAIRGKGGRSLRGNFDQYGLKGGYLDTFVSDLTNSPLRSSLRPDDEGGGAGIRPILFDAIVCDPPYGVREGLKVLGSRDPSKPKVPFVVDGVQQHLLPDYVHPKRPYSFDAMLVDILQFAVDHLVIGGKLCLWMPMANEDYTPLGIPTHPRLETSYVCVQVFNKWSRRLLTYTRKDQQAQTPAAASSILTETSGSPNVSEVAKLVRRQTANDLNNFRKKYFHGFQKPEEGVS